MTLRATTGWRWLLVLLMAAGLAWALRPLSPGQGPEGWFPGADKVHHLWFFALLWWLGVRGRVSPRWLIAAILLLYGIGIEVAQAAFAASRSASFADVLADTAGLLLGAVLTRPSPAKQLTEPGAGT